MFPTLFPKRMRIHLSLSHSRESGNPSKPTHAHESLTSSSSSSFLTFTLSSDLSLLAENLRDFHRHRVTSKGRGNLHTLHHVPDFEQRLLGDLHTFGARQVTRIRFAHALHDGRGNCNPRNLIIQKLCIAKTRERPQARDHGKPPGRDGLNAPEESL